MTITPSADIIGSIKSKKKYVLTFAGFGELGYQDASLVKRIIKDMLLQWRPHEVLVNCGTLIRVGGKEGIAQVYRLAKELGIETCGIHPSVSSKWAKTHPVSPFADHVYFVEDATWGGYLNDQLDLSPTLKVLLEVTDELIVIGGGKHAADELSAFLQKGKRVKYFPAQMNHQVTREWSEKAGIEPLDLNGAAYKIWQRRGKKSFDQ